MKTTKAVKFETYYAAISFINDEKGITNVRLYEDGQSVVMTYEVEIKK